MSNIRLPQKGRLAPRLGFAVLGVATVISVLIFGTLLIARAAPPSLYTPPESLMPGQPLPAGVMCAWPPLNEKMVHCHIFLDHDIYIVYDSSRGVIISTSVSLDDQASVGELIVAWGTPTGQRRYSWSTQVQWGSRYVYVSSRPFSPSNMPYFIHYTLEPDSVRAWNGFANRK
jgi:hypothetical protein